MNAAAQCPRAELAVAWTLHVLEPADEQALVEHLSSCHICREAMQQTEELTWLLSSAIEQCEPRPALRAELLAAVPATDQTPKQDRRPAWPAASGMPAGRSLTVGWHAEADHGASEKAAQRLREQRQQVRRRRLIAVAATVVVAVVGIGGLIYRQVVTAHQQQQLSAASPGQLTRILRQITRPGARYAVLNSSAGDPVAGVTIMGDQREVLPYALVPNDSAKNSYVLWGLSNASAVPIGAFDVIAQDRGLRRVGHMLTGNDPFTTYAISIEQGRTPPAAPGLIVATGEATR